MMMPFKCGTLQIYIKYHWTNLGLSAFRDGVP